MKIRNILGLALSALLFAACSEDDPIGTLDAIKLDKSFVSVPMEGGSVTVKVTATADWQIDGTYQKITKNADGTRDTTYTPLPNSPEWLTASQLSGTAGETTITFTATATEGGREAEIRIGSGVNKQFLVIRQGSLEASTATCAEVIAGPDNKNYRVTGTVMKIANTTYGNWYINDGTSDTDVYIYGTNDKNGKKGNNPIDGTDGWKFEVGDVVTLEGPKTTYGTTVELVDVTVIKVVKSLLKVVTPDAKIGVDGGDVEVKVAYKGSGAFFAIDDNAKSWLTYESVAYIPGIKTIFETAPADTAVFKFNVAANTGDSRNGTIKFSSNSGKNVSEIVYTVAQEAYVLPHGKNPEDPFTVAEAIAKCQEIGSTTDGELYYAKGKISSIKEVSTSYGNATFNISDDGTDANALTVFRSFFLNNEKFTAEDQIGVGDEVVIVGKLVNYTKGDQVTPEFSGNVYVYSLKKGSNNTAEAGTAEKPFTVAEAFSYIDKGGEDDVYVEGIVSKIVYTFSANYGTGTFWISSDGVFNDDLTKDFEAYSVYWLGNKSWVEGNGQVAVGDKVVLCGKLTKYVKNDKATYETASKKAYIYSINGKTE